MYLRVTHPPVAFDRYRALISSQLADELTLLASQLGHLRFVHINSTATGGGVAEILQSMVPLMNSLGITTEWAVIEPPLEFFQVTKHIHNLLQGAKGSLSSDELEVYYQSIEDVAEEIRRDQLEADVWFLHDPQLLPLAHILPRNGHAPWLWVVHIDLTSPNKEVLERLLPLTEDYDQLIFSLESYVPKELNGAAPVCIAPPAIDPLTAKNTSLNESQAQEIVTALGIDPARPLMTQVSRFDAWKDPSGVVDAFRLARQSVPGLQLALLGFSQATDDPESLEVLDQVIGHADGDPDIHTYFYTDGLPTSVDLVVNAFQVASQVLIQKSLREGFGLTVAEAMWKGKAVIGGNVGGIRIQIEDGVSGFLVDSVEECAMHVVQLVRDPALRARLGGAARASVASKFLLPRLALDYLKAAQACLARPGNGNGLDLEALRGLQMPNPVLTLPPNT